VQGSCKRQQHGLKPALDGTVTLEEHVVLELFGNQKSYPNTGLETGGGTFTCTASVM
jgi:hypothetical protein